MEAFNVDTVTAMPPDVDVALQWGIAGEAVGLRIDGDLIAVFDLRVEERKGRWATNEDENLFVRH